MSQFVNSSRVQLRLLYFFQRRNAPKTFPGSIFLYNSSRRGWQKRIMHILGKTKKELFILTTLNGVCNKTRSIKNRKNNNRRLTEWKREKISWQRLKRHQMKKITRKGVGLVIKAQPIIVAEQQDPLPPSTRTVFSPSAPITRYTCWVIINGIPDPFIFRNPFHANLFPWGDRDWQKQRIHSSAFHSIGVIWLVLQMDYVRISLSGRQSNSRQ